MLNFMIRCQLLKNIKSANDLKHGKNMVAMVITDQNLSLFLHLRFFQKLTSKGWTSF